MYKLILKKKAKNTMELLFIKDRSMHDILLSALINLQKAWTKDTQIKHIWEEVYRKRVGRRRILCTFLSDTILVWIIEMEKDTDKDYKRWKEYIQQAMKLFEKE